MTHCRSIRHLASISGLCNATGLRNAIESSQEGVPNLIFCLFSIGEKFVMTLRNILVAQTSVCAHFAMADSDGHRLKRLCDNPSAKRFCSVGLQADTAHSSKCPPEGGRYRTQPSVATQTLKPVRHQTPQSYLQGCGAGPSR